MFLITNPEELISNGSQRMHPFKPKGQKAHFSFLFTTRINMSCIKFFFPEFSGQMNTRCPIHDIDI